MTIVNDILKQMHSISQPQRKFLATLFATILALRGRVNYRNMSRYCDYTERTIARQFRANFDWPEFHQRVINRAIDPFSELLCAQDASFVPKSGKKTFGLGHFFNGCASRAERGILTAPVSRLLSDQVTACDCASAHHTDTTQCLPYCSISSSLLCKDFLPSHHQRYYCCYHWLLPSFLLKVSVWKQLIFFYLSRN
ncbi:MAG: hypothetical protein AB1489_40685 [Acidobacteriota bacterium]